jgi:hypothetical protein
MSSANREIINNDSPVTAVQEAMVLVSCLRLAKDREKRKAEQPAESVQQPDQ